MQDDASAVEKGLDLASVVPLTVQYAVDLVGDFYVVASQIATISLTSLQPLETFNSLVSTIANVHPYTQVALGVLTTDHHASKPRRLCIRPSSKNSKCL
ncbi:hypothetical protein SCLCIDRAFT_1109905 [Scleroderma citrinum Foug A]|uniref:Uncharacterized protein n=1 Tax=Scleroderma citrinum Foug A TaxID=1036808 RepID=A0A0C3ARQ5_9AGAM|nr:hypothetical protein SCLCIDRAFT_1109905 [Scleroderma citrinum Foug A]